MSVDFPRAWQIAREISYLKHRPKCSYRVTRGGMLCDCPILTDHSEYKDKVLHTLDGKRFIRRKNG